MNPRQAKGRIAGGQSVEQSTADALNPTPAIQKGKSCSRCKAPAAPHRRTTLGGNSFRVCNACSTLMESMRVAELIALQVAIDRGATCHATG